MIDFNEKCGRFLAAQGPIDRQKDTDSKGEPILLVKGFCKVGLKVLKQTYVINFE